MNPVPRAPLTVLYLAGAGRSGSTLLERMIGQLPGVVAAGELTLMWERSFRENQLCGCGVPFRECPFWREVVRLAFGGFDALDHAAAIELRASLCRIASIPALRYPALRTPGFRRRLERYRALLGPLYAAIAAVSGARVIVDSSKYPPEAYLLRTMNDIRLAVVHLVRESNAVAFAWQKRMVRPDVHWTTAYMPRYPFPQTAMAWNVFNLLIEALGGRSPVIRVRYEDLVARPRESVERVARLVGIESGALPFISAAGVSLAANHTVSGNPVRFQTGVLPLRLDNEWTDASPGFQRAAVTFLTYPLLRRYGYR